MEKPKTWQVPGCTEQGVNHSRAKQKGKCGELIRANKDGNLEQEIRWFQFLTQRWGGEELQAELEQCTGWMRARLQADVN